MLALRPNCEQCNKALPPASTQAMICSFECTFCRDCVQGVLADVCPNCGGGFCPRPIRPKSNLRNDNNLDQYPPSDKTVFKPVDPALHRTFAESIKDIPPHRR